MIRLENTPLTPDDIQKIMVNATGAKTKMVMLESIKPTDSVDSLFDPKYNDAVIFSPVMSKYNGHFQCMFRDGDTIYWFDSYGHTPAYLFSFVEDQYNRHDNPNMYKILANSGYKLIMNCVEYQGDKAADCGRFSSSVLFLRRLSEEQKQFDFVSYFNALKNYKERIGAPDFDYAVTDLTEKVLH